MRRALALAALVLLLALPLFGCNLARVLGSPDSTGAAAPSYPTAPDGRPTPPRPPSGGASDSLEPAPEPAPMPGVGYDLGAAERERQAVAAAATAAGVLLPPPWGYLAAGVLGVVVTVAGQRIRAKCGSGGAP